MAGRPPPRRVLISHTSELSRLPEERPYVAAAIDAVVRAGDAPLEMGYFGASPLPTSDYSIQAVDDADIYVAVIGFRYGTLVEDHPDVSYTELEFNTAVELGKPKLIFLLDGQLDLPLPPEYCHDPRYEDRQVAFRERLIAPEVTAAFIDTPDRLELVLSQSLRQLSTGLDRIATREHQPGTIASETTSLNIQGRPIAEVVAEGEYLIMNSQWADAEPLLRPVLGKAPTAYTDRLARGRTLVLAGRHGEALDVFSSLLREREDTMALAYRGEVYQIMDLPDPARKDLDRATRLDPHNSFAWCARGVLNQKVGRGRQARRDYARALAEGPGNVYALEALGMLEGWEKRYDACVDVFSRALRMAPNDTISLNGRGCAYLAEKRYSEALVDFTRSLQVLPGMPIPTYGRAAAEARKISSHDLAELRRVAFGMADRA